MTRETKIGLLVGLAFIIVIGILLSDHMTSTTQPQQAMLVDAAANVRESVAAPASAQAAPPPVTAVRQITPAHVVPTRTELNPPPVPAQPQPQPQAPVVESVQVGGPAGTAPGGDPILIRENGGGGGSFGPVQLEQPQPQAPSAPAPFGPVAEAPVPSPADVATAQLQQWAARQQAANAAGQAPPIVPVPPPAAAAPPAGREYVAQAGDNLSRLASRMLGSNTKANRDAIVRANPSLQRNPDLVVEGRKYKVPASVQSPAPAPAPAPLAEGTGGIPETVPVVRRSAPVPVAELVEAPPAAPAPRGGATRWYVVKENDNLWRIAADQLGSGNAHVQIKELNKDVLNGGESLSPGMRLRLPARAVASTRD